MELNDWNFARLYKMITDVCRELLWEVLIRTIHPPYSVFELVKDASSGKSKDQRFFKQLLSGLEKMGTIIPVHTDFDIASLCALLELAWKKQKQTPPHYRHCVEFIRKKRNELAHLRASITTEIYNSEYIQIREHVKNLEQNACLGDGIATNIFLRTGSRYIDMIDRIHSDNLYPDAIKKLIKECRKAMSRLQSSADDDFEKEKDEHLEASLNKEEEHLYPISEDKASTTPSHEKEHSIPLEIRLLDKKSVELYETALKFGKEKVYHIRLMVIGPYGVGKTCLINRLLKLGMKMEEIQSTVGIDVHRNTCGLNVPEREWIFSKSIKESLTNFDLRKWKVLKNYGNGEDNLTGGDNNMRPEDDFETTGSPPNYHNQAPINDQFQESLTNFDLRKWKVLKNYGNGEDNLTGGDNNMRPEDDFETTGSPTNYHNQAPINDQFQGSNADKGKMEPMPQRRRVAKSDEKSDPDSSLEIEQILKSGKDKDTEEIIGEISAWDFAGQFEFYSTHQTFLTPRAIYLLVVDMSMKIENKTKVTAGKRRPIEEMAENAEFWLQSIHTHSDQTGDVIHEKDHLLPHVILVGTHLDKFKEEKQQNTEVDTECLGKSETVTFFDTLRTHLIKKAPISVKHLYKKDFAVDNTKEDDVSVEDLRNIIYELASNQQYWGEEIPIRWISLEKKLVVMRKDKIVSFDVIFREAKNLTHKVENEEELNLFLTFQHNLGNIIYFSDLKEFIVLEVQWMINAFKSFITSNDSKVVEYLLRECPGKVELWKTFFRYGILEDKLIDAIWKEDFSKHKDHLLRLMEKHDILTKPLVCNENGKQETSNFYLVPCMVKDKINEIEISEIFSQVSSSSYLCFKFENSFLNPSIFHKLLTACMKNYTLSWKGKEKKLLLFYNCGIFDMDNSRTVRFFVGLSDYVLKLKVYQFGRELECSKSMEVKIFIEDKLKSLFDIYQHKHVSHTLHIKCLKSADSLDDMDGLFPVDDLTAHADLYCDAHSEKGHLVHSVELLKFWFESKYYKHLVQRKDETDICDKELERKKGKIHADLKVDLCGKLPTSEQSYKDFLMRLECQALIPKADVVKATNDVYRAFDLMESKGCMKPGDYGTLKELLANEKSLVETIEKHEEKFQCL